MYIFFTEGVILQICEILRHVNSLESEKEILDYLKKLTIVDPLRQGYYAYLGILN